MTPGMMWTTLCGACGSLHGPGQRTLPSPRRRELRNLRAELGHASGLLEQRARRLDSYADG
jgi:hypothetical protein